MISLRHRFRTFFQGGLLGIFLFTVGGATDAAEAAPDRDQSWQHLKALQQQLSGNAPKGVNEIEFFAPVKAQLHREATDIAGSAGNDPRRWEARLLELKTDTFPTPAAERKVMFAQHEQIVADIKQAPNAPPEIKQNAERTILFQHLDHLDLIATPPEAAVMEKRLVAFLHDYPNDPKASSMQVRRLDLLAKSDPAKVRPLLDELAASNDPKVAAAARGRQELTTLVPVGIVTRTTMALLIIVILVLGVYPQPALSLLGPTESPTAATAVAAPLLPGR